MDEDFVGHTNGYKIARADFSRPTVKFRSYVFFEINEFPVSETLIARLLNMCCKNTIGGVIPSLGDNVSGSDEEIIEGLMRMYSNLLPAAREYGIHVGFNLEKVIERYIVRRNLLNGKDIGCKILKREKYFCTWDEDVCLKLKNDKVLAVIAYSHDSSEIEDLTPYVVDGTVRWKASYGNWVITQYICDSDGAPETADYLNYNACKQLISDAFDLFYDAFEDNFSVISTLYYNDICFNAHNRTNWTPSFRETFMKDYGFDPNPHIVSLYHYVSSNERHIKTLLLDCRAKMLKNGIIKAFNDFCVSHGLRLECVITEPKLSAPSLTTGDAMLDNCYSPCALLDKSYLYGVNSIKLAAGAAYNFNNDRVCCELFRDYRHIDSNIVFRDTMNAFARGANAIMIRLSENGKYSDDPRTSPEYCKLIARVQALLRGGVHVSDIAMLYPIYSLHSKVYMYHDNSTGFEYPDTPIDTDYMTLLNSLSIYSGHDLTLLHPETLNNFVHSEGGNMYLNTETNHEKFSVFVLPSTEVISLKSLEKIKEFYDCGGKIIGTGNLPSLAFEYTPCDKNGNNRNDAKVKEIIDHIFGPDASDRGIIKEFCYNRNENGGEAYFLYFSRTAADGTNSTAGSVVNEALRSFNIPFDIYMPDMPRYECSGALNNNYPEFKRLHLDVVIPGGGMFSRLHKRRDGLDIYYFSNTTDSGYSHEMYVKGAILPERWDPHDGSRSRLNSSFVKFKGEIYTKFKLELGVAKSVFIISDIEKSKSALALTAYIPELCEL